MYVLCLHYTVPNPLCRRLSQRAFNLGNQRVNYVRYCQTLTCFRETDCAWRVSNALVNVLCRWVRTSIDWQLLRNVIYCSTNCINNLQLADPPGFAQYWKQLSVWNNVLTTVVPFWSSKFKYNLKMRADPNRLGLQSHCIFSQLDPRPRTTNLPLSVTSHSRLAWPMTSQSLHL